MNNHELAIQEIAARSPASTCRWEHRGPPPIGYTKGMALCFARLLLKLREQDAAAKEAAKPPTDEGRDAISFYRDEFTRLGLNIDVSGEPMLTNVCVMLFGLGMQESSGHHCDGKDASAQNESDETCEAGLFQLSYNSRRGSRLLPDMIERYRGSEDLLPVFAEGVRCSDDMWRNHGVGAGVEFQELTKRCPAFAVEYAAVALRNVRRQWGTIADRDVVLKIEVDGLFAQIRSYLDQNAVRLADLEAGAGAQPLIAILRDKILDLVDQALADKSRQLIAALANEGYAMVPTFGLRDPWTQARLWRQSRTREQVDEKIAELRQGGGVYLAEILESVGPQADGPWRTNAPPGLSWHQHGKAVDFGFKSPHTGRVLEGGPEDGDEFKYAEEGFALMGAVSHEFGLTWGGEFKSNPDDNHIQLPAEGSPIPSLTLAEIDDKMRQLWPAGRTHP